MCQTVQFLLFLETIYEACIMITDKKNHSSNGTYKYQGEVLVDYEANTHFIIDDTRVAPQTDSFLKDSEISNLKSQANQVLNATQEYLKLQAQKQETSRYEF
jgi:hypothetical protein